jgi:hypothetical protein
MTHHLLNKSNPELLGKYYDNLKLSGSIQKFGGRGFSSTSLLLFQIPSGIKENQSCMILIVKIFLQLLFRKNLKVVPLVPLILKGNKAG